MNWKTVPAFFSFTIFLRKEKSSITKAWRTQTVSHVSHVSPAASQARLLFDPATASSRETVCRLLKVLETGGKTAPFPWLSRVCAARAAAQSSPAKDWTGIQARCLSKQDRVREDTTALRDCCLAPATRRRGTSLWIMSREHKGDGYWTVANLYKQKGVEGRQRGGIVRKLKIHYVRKGERSTDGENARGKTKAERSRKIQRE